MQYIGFDFTTMLLSFLFFLATCQMSEPTSVTVDKTYPTTTIIEPKDEGENDYREVTTKLTLILFDTEGLHAYEGNDVNSVTYYRYAELGGLLKASKKKYPEGQFVVLIKPAPKASYKNTVDVLDAMSIHGIKRYSITQLFPEEKAALRLE